MQGDSQLVGCQGELGWGVLLMDTSTLTARRRRGLNQELLLTSQPALPPEPYAQKVKQQQLQYNLQYLNNKCTKNYRIKGKTEDVTSSLPLGTADLLPVTLMAHSSIQFSYFLKVLGWIGRRLTFKNPFKQGVKIVDTGAHEGHNIDCRIWLNILREAQRSGYTAIRFS